MLIFHLFIVGLLLVSSVMSSLSLVMYSKDMKKGTDWWYQGFTFAFIIGCWCFLLAIFIMAKPTQVEKQLDHSDLNVT